MTSPFLDQPPEIIFSALTGPGTAAPTMGLQSYLYAVYSFPVYVYTGLPECIPPLDAKRVIQSLEPQSVPQTLLQRAQQMFILREDEFLKACWRGSLWATLCLYSKTAETFTEAGAFMAEKRSQLVSRDAVKRWLEGSIDPDDTAAMDESLAWTYAEMACLGNLSSSVTVQDVKTAQRRITDEAFRHAEKERLGALFRTAKLSLPPRIKREELNGIVISVRGLA